MLSREPANFRVDASVKGRRGRLNDCLVSRDGERRGMREYDVIPLLFSFLFFSRNDGTTCFYREGNSSERWEGTICSIDFQWFTGIKIE